MTRTWCVPQPHDAGIVEFDEQARIFHGEVIGLRDVISFQGTSVEELEKAMAESVDFSLAWCAERGKTPEKPFSGKLTVCIGYDTL
ncbi:MAG: type II toxin-antitoxin system HicB family antitoxin [Spirochaetaceae bacterium]|nr:MAG: type II toxin-antitoxin system HicB family antitoxin [Spirochaetaceae bacterium]